MTFKLRHFKIYKVKTTMLPNLEGSNFNASELTRFNLKCIQIDTMQTAMLPSSGGSHFNVSKLMRFKLNTFRLIKFHPKCFQIDNTKS